MSKKSSLVQMIPVMLCFFAMGFVDLVGTATNQTKDSLGLSESIAGLIPFSVFAMFFFFSVPTGMLMNKIGRKKTVLISLVVTAVALVLPLFENAGQDMTLRMTLMFAAFGLLGIGNAIMQTSLNPLVSNLISDDKLASTLTFGQFVKAIASFCGPIIVVWGASAAAVSMGLSWKVVFMIYAAVSLIAVVALGATPIEEQPADKASGIGECLKLLAKPFILVCFIGIMCHVGIDVGINRHAPLILGDALGTGEAVTIATSIYFAFRTLGCFAGSFLLRIMAAKQLFLASVVMMIGSMVLMAFNPGEYMVYGALALVGLGNSNIFPVIFAQALEHAPKERNEVSGLMIMGLVGGAVFPLAMSYLSDWMGTAEHPNQLGAVVVMAALVLFLLLYTTKIKSVNVK